VRPVKRVINIKFQNGITKEIASREILNEFVAEYSFEESENPDFILFGPYGSDIPSKGNYIRIGYFCENIKPDLSICEWAFGIPREEEIANPKYKRIQWHGVNPNALKKNLSDNEIDKLISSKTKFCNFLYSSHIPYREEFFKQLSKYKKIDAPGRSMNNMLSIDTAYPGNQWQRKREFLTPYKFTIAFENYSYPGYQTEKLYDAMQVNSIPIYCGDPYIGNIFNTSSFLNSIDYVKPNNNKVVKWLEKSSQSDFDDILPTFRNSFHHRVRRKVKAIGKDLKMKLQYNGLDFKELIDKIIAIDNNTDLYIKYLKEPWFKENQVPEQASMQGRWIEIFNPK
jgi:hypothetical protein